MKRQETYVLESRINHCYQRPGWIGRKDRNKCIMSIFSKAWPIFGALTEFVSCNGFRQGMTWTFSTDRMRKRMSLVPSSPDILSVTVPSPLHYSNSLPQTPRDAAGASLTPKILPPNTLSEAEGEHLSLFSYHPYCSQQDPHQNALKLLRNPWGNFGRGERGEEREEEECHSGSLPLLEGCKHSPACFMKAPQTLHWSREGHCIPGVAGDWTDPGGAWIPPHRRQYFEKSTHLMREEGKTMLKTCPPHPQPFPASTWSKWLTNPNPEVWIMHAASSRASRTGRRVRLHRWQPHVYRP